MMRREKFVILFLIILIGYCSGCNSVPQTSDPAVLLPAPTNEQATDQPVVATNLQTAETFPLPVEKASPLFITPPLETLVIENTIVFTETPQIANTYIEPTATPVPTLDNAYSDLVNACSLIDSNELLWFFPVIPESNYRFIDDGKSRGSVCFFQDQENSLSIAVAMDFRSVIEISHHVSNIKRIPDYVNFTYSGADIFAVAGYSEQDVSYGFAGIIYRKDISVEVIGTAKSFPINLESGIHLLQNIADRLPPYTEYVDRIDACSLSTENEIAALFSISIKPKNEYKFSEYDLISVCTYEDENVSLVINLGYINQEDLQVLSTIQHLFVTTIPGAQIFADFVPGSEPDSRNSMTGAVIKGDILVSINASGKQFYFDRDRVMQWLALIASRLP